MSPFPRTLAVAVTALVTSAGIAQGQRGARGTMGVPRVNSPPAPAPTSAPAPSSSGRGVMYVPAAPQHGPTGPRGGDVPRITTRQGSGYGRSYRSGSGYGGSSYGGGSTTTGGSGYGSGVGIGFGTGSGHRFEPGVSRRWRPGYSIPGYGAACGIGCVRIGVGGRTSRFFGSFSFGYPFAVPIYVPYFFSTTVERYVEPAAEPYMPEPEPGRAASKLIVIGGGTGGGGDALTIETVADSVRLQWLGAGRQAREVRLFVADSAQQTLASRSASPAAPTATFEIATLSAPVAFAGVTVTFADGVTTTTLVPYRRQR